MQSNGSWIAHNSGRLRIFFASTRYEIVPLLALHHLAMQTCDETTRRNQLKTSAEVASDVPARQLYHLALVHISHLGRHFGCLLHGNYAKYTPLPSIVLRSHLLSSPSIGAVEHAQHVARKISSCTILISIKILASVEFCCVSSLCGPPKWLMRRCTKSCSEASNELFWAHLGLENPAMHSSYFPNCFAVAICIKHSLSFSHGRIFPPQGRSSYFLLIGVMLASLDRPTRDP